MDEIKNRLDNMGKKILTASKNELYVSMRFLDMALGGLEFEKDENAYEVATDGQKLYFNPEYLIEKYSLGRQNINHIYLHSILHCIFRHIVNGKSKNTRYWDMACDIAVEYVADKVYFPDSKIPPEKKKVYSFLENRLKTLSAEGIYNTLTDFMINGNDYNMLMNLFHVDSHRYWFGNAEIKKEDSESSKTKKSDNVDSDNTSDIDVNSKNREQIDGDSKGGKSGNDGKDSSGENEQDENKGKSGNTDEETANTGGSENSPDNGSLNEKECRISNKWKNISERVKTNIETMSSDEGRNTKSILKNIDVSNRDVYDYGNFLRKFAVVREEIKVDDDSFDYIFYTYGMKLYKNMPLIEPLEYKESVKIDEFAIAVDTSGSCDGNKIKDFLKTTFEILKNSETFFRKVKIHIIQCDEQIQDDMVITDIEQIERLCENFKVRGYGGTDFRPVFEYIEKLKHNGFKPRGLIYFTDGMGTYPLKAPNYDTAFVFLRDSDYSDVDVPPWAMKVIIEKR